MEFHRLKPQTSLLWEQLPQEDNIILLYRNNLIWVSLHTLISGVRLECGERVPPGYSSGDEGGDGAGRVAPGGNQGLHQWGRHHWHTGNHHRTRWDNMRKEQELHYSEHHRFKFGSNHMTLYTLTVQVADSMASAYLPFLNACTCTCKYLALSPIHSHIFNVTLSCMAVNWIKGGSSGKNGTTKIFNHRRYRWP